MPNAIPQPPTDVAALARQLLAEHGDTVAAAAALQAKAESSAPLLKALTQNALRDCCLTAVRSVLHSDRRQAWSPPPLALSVTAHSNAIVRSLLEDFRLPGGKALGDADKTDLTEAAAIYAERASDAAGKAAWLAAIAKALPEGKRVREKFSEKRLSALRSTILGQDREAA